MRFEPPLLKWAYLIAHSGAAFDENGARFVVLEGRV